MCACLWAFVISRLGEWQGCQLWRDGGHRIGFPSYYVWLLFVNIFPPEKWGNYDILLSLSFFGKRHWPRSMWQSHARHHGVATQWHMFGFVAAADSSFSKQERNLLERSAAVFDKVLFTWQRFNRLTKLQKVSRFFTNESYFLSWKRAQVKKFIKWKVWAPPKYVGRIRSNLNFEVI